MKNTFYISCPIDTYSGYGARARDFVRALIELEDYDVKIIPQKWGSTPMGFIDDNKEKWGFLRKHILPGQMTEKPDYWCQITVPNEFQPIGKFNIGLTAGIETNLCAPQWIEGMNRMDLILTSSVHSANVLKSTSYKAKDTRKGTEVDLKLNKPIEVIIEGADLDTFKIIKNNKLQLTSLKDKINSIPEKFAYLSVGHWMQGDMGHDRKNLGTLIAQFYDLFKSIKEKPALLLKCSMAGSSYMSSRQVLKNISDIRRNIKGKDLPNVYLISGDFTDEEMNELYNHHKIKAMVSLTHGEGFGRPLLEFSLTGKPIIASGWSGHLDFLHKDYTSLVNGELKVLHPSSVQENILIKESSWFSPHDNHARYSIFDVYSKYKVYKERAKKQKEFSKSNFSFDVMKNQIKETIDHYSPNLPKKMELDLSGLGEIKLPKKEKIEANG